MMQCDCIGVGACRSRSTTTNAARQIGDAVCRVIAARGLDAVSLRHVAAEAGVSMGRVQHYFATKDEMLMFAFELISDRVAARFGAIVRSTIPRTFLRAILLELLPLSAAARAEAPVLAAFLAQAVVEPRLGEPLRSGQPRDGGVAGGHDHRAVRPDGDAERDAMALLAFVDGLMLQVLIGQVTPEAAVDLVDHQLDRVMSDATATPEEHRRINDVAQLSPVHVQRDRSDEEQRQPARRSDSDVRHAQQPCGQSRGAQRP